MSENADKFWQSKEEKLKKKIEKVNEIAKTMFFLNTSWEEMQYGKIIKLVDANIDKELEFDMLRDAYSFLDGIMYIKERA